MLVSQITEEQIKDAIPKDIENQCLWKGCRIKCQRYRWGCQTHWDMLPMKLKRLVRRYFHMNESIRVIKRPSQAKALVLINAWIVANGLEEKDKN